MTAPTRTTRNKNVADIDPEVTPGVETQLAAQGGADGAGGATNRTTVGMGIDIEIPKTNSDGTKTTEPIALYVPDVTALGTSGNFTFELDPDTTVSFTFLDFYTGLKGMFTFLPDLDFNSMPDPVPTLVNTVISIKRFNIVIQNKAIVRFAISVDLQFNWTVPGTTVKVQTFRLAVDYGPDGTPSLQTGPVTPAVEGGGEATGNAS